MMLIKMQELIIIMEASKTLFCSTKIPMGARKSFLDICRKFGDAHSKSFASPVIKTHQDGTILRLTFYQDITPYITCALVYFDFVCVVIRKNVLMTA